MTNIDPNTRTQPARTQAEAAARFRRPFAPGAVGFRAMTKVPYQGELADQAAQPAHEQPAETPAPNGNGRVEVVSVDFGDLGPAA